MEQRLKKLERILGGPKFAVVIITIFGTLMTIGTFLESYYGTDFANRLLYKNWPFILVQACMLISVCFAVFLRLPPRRRLYGFYTIHAGLVTIGLGSLVTYLSGIDGNIFLPPNEPARKVLLADDVLTIDTQDTERRLVYKLPYKAFATDLGIQSEGFSLGRYLPFADELFEWREPTGFYGSRTGVHSSEYLLSNGNVSQRFLLSLHPEQSRFRSSLRLGPLDVNYLPKGLGACFSLPSASGYILWNSRSGKCFTAEQRGLEIVETKSGKRFFALKDESGAPLSFFPDLSPWPMDEEMNVVAGGNWRTFSKNLFTGKPALFLFGRSLAYHNKEEGRWVSDELGKEPIDLPWMGFSLSLLDHSDDRVPDYKPISAMPIQKDNELIKGTVRALEIRTAKRSFWVTNTKPLHLLIDGKKTSFILQKESLTLPYELILSHFKMDRDPGTDRPASYESFVSLFTSEGPRDAHVYMNNPLVHEGLTFYQASYSQNADGSYSSTLSVNLDKGRLMKYFGSLLLVIGAVAHYLLNRKPKKTKRGELVALGAQT